MACSCNKIDHRSRPAPVVLTWKGARRSFLPIPPMPPGRAHGSKHFALYKWPRQHVPSAQLESLRPQPIVRQRGSQEDGRGIGSARDLVQQIPPYVRQQVGFAKHHGDRLRSYDRQRGGQAMGLVQLPFRVVEDLLQREVNLFGGADGENRRRRVSHDSASPFRLVNECSCSKRMAAGGVPEPHREVAITPRAGMGEGPRGYPLAPTVAHALVRNAAGSFPELRIPPELWGRIPSCPTIHALWHCATR